MAMTGSESVVRLQPPFGRCPQLASAASHPARRDDKQFEASQRKAGADDGTSSPIQQEISFGPFRLYPARRMLLENDKPVRIGSRALDLLITLVNQPGELVSKAELMAKVWPHAFVEEGNLKVQIGALRRTLADGQGDNRYISSVAGRGYCFVAPVTQAAAHRAATAQHSTPKPLTNIPKPLMRLFGIEIVIGKVSDQLLHHRLVTLVGPGGIGKTSVAIATAEGLTDSYEHGVWFIDLTDVSDQRRLLAAIGSSICPGICAENWLTNLPPFLCDKRMLLVLDNCEHMIDAVAAFAFQVMQTAPHVQILATSREPLSVEEERLHHLHPMEIPPSSSTLSAVEALEFPAVQLFTERAANILGEFKLRDTNASIVIDICRKLDGIPLAIELAAASIDTLGLRGIVSRLDHPLQLPATRRRTAAPRHRTLRAVLDWSYNLLTEEERRVLHRLSVFADSFTMEAAVTLDGNSAHSKSEFMNQVIALVAKSLVSANGDGVHTRLRLLATTRAYAFERLAESGDLARSPRNLTDRTEPAA